MKIIKLLLATVIVALLFSSCANDKTLVINGKETLVQAYGLANEDTRKVEGVVYEIPAENWIVGILFSETLLVPGYIVGWDLYEPVRVKE